MFCTPSADIESLFVLSVPAEWLSSKLINLAANCQRESDSDYTRDGHEHSWAKYLPVFGFCQIIVHQFQGILKALYKSVLSARLGSFGLTMKRNRTQSSILVQDTVFISAASINQ